MREFGGRNPFNVSYFLGSLDKVQNDVLGSAS